MSHRRHAVALIVSVVAALLPSCMPKSLRGQEVVIDVNRAAAVRIAAAQEQAAAGQYDDAIRFLTQIVASSGDELTAFGNERLRIPVRRACQQVIGSLPPAGLAVYRAHVDAQVLQWLAQAEGDSTQLRRIVREHPYATAGDEALHRLGLAAWSLDRRGQAYEFWRQLIPRDAAAPASAEIRFPDSRYPVATVAARLVMSRAAMGDDRFARAELHAFQRAFPESVGRLAGESGTLADILSQQLDNPDWFDVPTPPVTWNVLWSRDLRPVTGIRPQKPVQAIASSPDELAVYPLATPAGVCAADAFALHAMRWETGQNLWTGQPTTLIEATQQRYPLHATVGPPAFEPAKGASRLLVRLGSPVTSPASREPAELMASELRCLDVGTRQGKLIWRRVAESIVADATFESSPAVFDSLCFAALRTRTPDNSLHLCCLDLEDGRLRWTQRLCSGLDVAPENRNLVTAVQPLASSEHVLVPTNNGAVFALTHAGRFAWVRTYARRETAQVWPPRDGSLLRHGVLYLSPPDSAGILAIREHTGDLLWEGRVADSIRHVVAVVRGRVIVSGRAPWALTTTTGQVVWGGPRYAPEYFGFGRPAVTGRTLLFPTRAGVEVRDALTGNALRSPIPVSGGNIAIAGNHAAVMAHGRLTVLQAD